MSISLLRTHFTRYLSLESLTFSLEKLKQCFSSTFYTFPGHYMQKCKILKKLNKCNYEYNLTVYFFFVISTWMT